MQLERRLGGLAGATGVPPVCSAAAVAATPLDQQAAGEEDGVGGPQLLPQVDGVVARSAAVALDVVVEAVQINWAVGRGSERTGQERELLFKVGMIFFFQGFIIFFFMTALLLQYLDFFLFLNAPKAHKIPHQKFEMALSSYREQTDQYSNNPNT